MLSLLGLAGSTAAVVASWLSPVLIGLSAALLARAHYVLYILKRGSRMSRLITWLATVLVMGFWTWKLVGPVAPDPLRWGPEDPAVGPAATGSRTDLPTGSVQAGDVHRAGTRP